MLNRVEKLHLFFLSFWLAVYKMRMRVVKNWEGFLSAVPVALTGKLLIDNEGTLCTGDGQTNDSHPYDGMIT